MIEVNELKKAYGDVQAIRGVNFSIAPGEIVGLLGPNGAGKSTIIKTLTGFLQPDSGVVTVAGLDVLSHTQAVQEQIGYLPENAPLYPELLVQDYLQMIVDLRKIPAENQLSCISDAIHAVAMEDVLLRPIGQLSKGYRQRLGLAQAIIHRPDLLILDEPTVGLDPTQVVEIRRLIKRLSQHSTVLFSTHILPEVEVLCDRVIILMNGEIKADARLSDLAMTTNVVMVVQKDVQGAVAALSALQGVEKVERIESGDLYPAYYIYGAPNSDLSPSVFRLASENNWPLRELRCDVRTLESVFNELTLAS